MEQQYRHFVTKTVPVTSFMPIRCRYQDPKKPIKNKYRCKNLSLIGPLCNTHLESQYHLQVKKSGIPSCSLGLYATKDFQKHEILIKYVGVSRWTLPRNTAYIVELVCPPLHKKKYIDSQIPSLSNAARFANDANGLRKHPTLTNNCQFYEYNHEAFIRATRLIKAGDEVLVDYGEHYWKYFY